MLSLRQSSPLAGFFTEIRCGNPVGGGAMTELRLALLGPPVVLRDGTPVTFDTRKAIALLALLAVTGREHSRDQLADLLWPEADSTKGRASLRRTLSVTAAAMGDGLSISRAAVTLELAAVQVDVRGQGPSRPTGGRPPA